MTLGNEDHRINEIQLRRRLRLQQVREQSNDIAKKIRQRAKLAKLRHILEIDTKKENEYFECQEKLIKRLEKLYAEGVDNVGVAHKNVRNLQGCVNKKDLSKLRGKEAAATLRKEKQEKLDEQKKLLDRKLKAREAANELSREKSVAILKNLDKLPKDTEQNKEIHNTTPVDSNKILKDIDNAGCSNNQVHLKKNDMGTQWEGEDLPQEWEPHVPFLQLPNDNPKDFASDNVDQTSKHLNLFALSEDMMQSMNVESTINPAPQHKPSLTLVSEYLQNRSLRLRQVDPPKKRTEDLHSIKQTILRTRATKTNGNKLDNVCHVLDGQEIPVPSWQAEYNCKLYNHVKSYCVPNFNCNCKKVKRHLEANSNIVTQNKFTKFASTSICHKHNLCSGPCYKSGDLKKYFVFSVIESFFSFF